MHFMEQFIKNAKATQVIFEKLPEIFSEHPSELYLRLYDSEIARRNFDNQRAKVMYKGELVLC